MKQLLLGLTLLCLGACKKDDPNVLPAATQEGRNTAGFLLDGQPWLPKNSPSSSLPYPVNAYFGHMYKVNYLSIGISRYQDGNNRQAFGLYFSNIRKPGTYLLEEDFNRSVISGPRPAYGAYTIYSPSPKTSFYTGPTARGQVIITRFDTVARVVAGTFEARVQEDGGTITHDITQGRFDIKF
ncbi:hypothetical protein [Hymenobacter sp. BT559]|uniref:hypothetical protein n=1 Tax=Hymenobacter sp. BT559 TaxID=2795729 RepID=UPI0018EAF38D|nr:hypothetical protein [Hymenobacter sp. BT559]MBJ6143570.1 hypothetical protein [Hymenobacter sp. BT559]